MTHVLWTGGAGYLCAVTVGHLLQRGYHVMVLDSLLYGHPNLLSYCSHPRFDFVLGDCRDERVVSGPVERHDALSSLAAIIRMKTRDRYPLMTRSVNYETIALLNRLHRPNQPDVSPCTNSGLWHTIGRFVL